MPRKPKKAVILLPPDMQDCELIIEMIPVAQAALAEDEESSGDQPATTEEGELSG